MKLDSRFNLKRLISICTLFTIFIILYFGYFCSVKMTRDGIRPARMLFNSDFRENYEEPAINFNNHEYKTVGLSYDSLLNKSYRFDINSHDVMVFLHIQKTGGTSFGRHLVQDLDLEKPCTCQRKRKRCYCFRPNKKESWLFSRYSTGWKCGLHADWTELTACVDNELNKYEGNSFKRRYFYITLLREPISRYLSEFKHVQRGATWHGARHWCGGRVPTERELPKCYSGINWRNVTMDEFISCPDNLASNRQTRMMCDLSLIGCYNKSYMDASDRDRVMLASAKRNLASMAFFALTEYQKISQYLFEETFNLRFGVPFTQHNSTRSSSYITKLRSDQLDSIHARNALDIELYEFAKSLLFRRFEKLRSRDSNFLVRWKNLGLIVEKSAFNWDDEVEPDPVDSQYIQNSINNLAN